MKLKPYMIRTKEYMKVIQETDRYTAYGNFLDRFRYCKDRDIQWELIRYRPDNDDMYPIDAAKIAATVEVLAKEYGFEVPDWVMNPKYILREPYYAGVNMPDYQKFLKDTAIPEFAKRNLFLGDNCMNRA